MTPARVLLLVTGGIAAYKSCQLTRLLVQAGFSVRVAMTEAAQRFVTPMTFQVLSGHPVATDLWGEGGGEVMDHIELAREADVVLVAPATANLLAKAAHGIADDLVTTLLLAHPGVPLLAPAMNDNMWRHPATQANVAVLRERGAVLVGPAEGDLACGTVSVGRMVEPGRILAALRAHLAGRRRAGPPPGPPPAAAPAPAVEFWAGRRLIVTAGPTHEPIDPVRFLANRSSGVFGYALAEAAARLGADVALISGPTALAPPPGISRLRTIETAAEMATAVRAEVQEGADWLLMAAAVADFRPARPEAGKIKKESRGANWSLELVGTEDILAGLGDADRPAGLRLVGFALETEDLAARAAEKLARKGLDFVVANDPTRPGGTFGEGDHSVLLIGPEGVVWQSGPRPKPELAAALLGELAAAAGAGCQEGGR